MSGNLSQMVVLLSLHDQRQENLVISALRRAGVSFELRNNDITDYLQASCFYSGSQVLVRPEERERASAVIQRTLGQQLH